MTLHHLLLGIFVFCIYGGSCEAHEISELLVPSVADPRKPAILRCRYNMGLDQLYSTKWFKDKSEIYRYMPGQNPSGLIFPVPGVTISKRPDCSHWSCDLELSPVVIGTAGVYRCEVSNEAPTFRIVQKNASMAVAALPLRDPLVEGAATAYSIGDEIRVNCTSDPALPAPLVTWYMNDEEVPYPHVEEAILSEPGDLGLKTRSRVLSRIAEKQFFTGKDRLTVRLKCVTSMPPWLPGGPYKREFTIAPSLKIPIVKQTMQWASFGAASNAGGLINPILLAIIAILLGFT